MTCSIMIPSQVAEKTAKRLGKLASKAGVELSTIAGTTILYRQARESYLARDHVKYRLTVDTNQVLECARITIGDLPRFNGHTFIGKVTHTAEGNLVVNSPAHTDRVLPLEFRTAKPTCDHCNTVRGRKDTFIIETPEGKLMRVGRNCLADFLMASPEQLIALSVFADALYSLSVDRDSDGEHGESYHYGFSPLHFLACAVSAIEANGGFVPSQCDTGHTPTRQTAAYLANQRNATLGRDADRKAWRDGQPKAEHWAKVVSCLLWLEEQAGDQQYIHNLKVACLQPVCNLKIEGLIASLPQAYDRAMGEVPATQLKASAANSYYGTVGQRAELEVTLVGVHGYVGSFGPGHVVRMRTAEQHEIVTFTTSGSAPAESEVGSKLSIRGTVKAHSVRDNVKQTILSRVTW